jgi:ABC-2 type transport system permease protein
MISAPPRRGALHDLALLLRLHLSSLRRAPAGRSGRAQRLPAWSRYAVLLLVAGLIVANLGSRLVDLVGGAAGRALLSPILTWASSTAMLLLFLFAIPLAVATFTYRSDMRLLLLTPLSPRVIMLEKFILVYCQVALFVWAIGIPLLLGIGSSLNLGWGYGAAAVVMLLLLPAVPVALALLLLSLVVRWLPPRQARTLTTVFGSVLAIAFYVGTQVLGGRGAGQTSNLRALFTQSTGSWWQNLPTTWPGRAVAAAGHGDSGTALTYLGVTAALSIALCALVLALLARLFATGWASYQEVGRRRTSTGDVVPTRAAPSGGARAQPPSMGMMTGARRAAPVGVGVQGRGGVAPTLRQVWRPLWRKEWRTMRRDAQTWARLLYPLVVVGFALYRVLAQSAGTGRGFHAETITLFTTTALALYFPIVFLAPRLINGDGRAVYLLALAPVSPRSIFLVKWACCALPALVFALPVLLIGTVHGYLTLGQMAFSACALCALVAAFAAAALLASITWPRLNWDNPGRQVSLPASLASAFGGLVLVIGTCVLLGLTFAWWPDHTLAACAAGAGIFVLTGALIAVALAVAPSRLLALFTARPHAH